MPDNYCIGETIRHISLAVSVCKDCVFTSGVVYEAGSIVIAIGDNRLVYIAGSY